MSDIEDKCKTCMNFKNLAGRTCAYLKICLECDCFMYMPNEHAATTELCARIENAIGYCRQEWNLTYAQAIGCLEIIKAGMLAECLEDEGAGDE